MLVVHIAHIARLAAPRLAASAFLLACITMPEQASAQAFRQDVGPGQGPRQGFREEDWEFWWYLNREVCLATRRAQLRPVAAGSLNRDELLHVIEALRAQHEVADPRVRAAAIMALAKTRDPSVRNDLDAALADPALPVRRTAALALGVMGDPQSAVGLERVVLDRRRDADVRFHAAIAMGLLDSVSESSVVEVPDPLADSVVVTARIDDLGDGVRTLTANDSAEWVMTDRSGTILFVARDGTRRIMPHEAATRRAESAPAGPLVACAFIDGSAGVLNTRIGKSVTNFACDGDGVTAMAWDPLRAERLAIAFDDGTASLFHARTGRQTVRFERHEGPVRDVAWDADAKRIASCGDDGTVRVWTARRGTEMQVLHGHDGPVLAVAFEPGPSGSLATGGSDGLVRIFSLGNGRGSGEGGDGEDNLLLAMLPAAVSELRWSPDGEVLAVASVDGTVRLFDARDKTLLANLGPFAAGHGSPVSIAWARDGARLAIGTDDGSLMICDTAHIGAASREAGEFDDPGRTDEVVTARFARLLAPNTFSTLDSSSQKGVALGAGLTGDPALLKPLETLLTTRKPQGAVVRTYLVQSLGRLVGAEQVDRLARHLDDDNALVRRSAALQLGRLLHGTQDEDQARRIVKKYARESDVMTRNYISLALGRIGARAGLALLAQNAGDVRGTGSVGGGNGIARPPNISLGGRSRQPFAALALGLGRQHGALEWLASSFNKEKQHSARAALAVALGLLADQRASPSLLNALRKANDPALKSYLAQAVGMLADERARETLRESVRREPDAELVVQAAMALDMMQDEAVVSLLLARLAAHDDPPDTRRAILYALGRLRDPRALEAILAVLADADEIASVREYAAVALGDMASPDARRRLDVLFHGMNLTAEPQLLDTLFKTL